MRDNTPVLIGAGQYTHRGAPETAPSPLELLKIAAERAATDAGLPMAALAGLDAMSVVGFTIDAGGQLAAIPAPRLVNPPASLAAALDCRPSDAVYSQMGGNAPQYMINRLCERIARGDNHLGLVVGAEFLGSLMKRLTGGLGFAGWETDDHYGPPARAGDPREGVTKQEALHGLNMPVNTYPLFENALRARDGRSISDHQARLGALFAPFSQVAADNPDAWFRMAHSADDLVRVGPNNRMISFPYPKRLNAIMQVDQSAGVLIASVAKARELGVPEDRWVYLHGCADAADLWYPLERQNFHSSPAIRETGRRALEMAGINLAELSHIDLYSCFPVAVEIAAEELGLELDDPRGLTVTGGLPYFGGPGNNYALHSVATMTKRLRAHPGGYGLCTGNGWFLTKQSAGIYSTRPLEGIWEREDPSVIQARIDALPHPPIIEHPEGEASIETYTVVHTRDAYRMGIIIGRDGHDRRFVAVTPNDEVVLRDLEAREGVGRPGMVSRHPDGVRNLFVPA